MALVIDGAGPGDPIEAIAGRYRVEACLAKGGMGAVYRVFDEAAQRMVALKRIRGTVDRRAQHMFEREFYTLAGLKHPRIIEVYDYGVDAHGAYYTMELLDGRDLRELAPLPYKIACRYLRDVAASLALLHARNLLHRDLSPRNVRITSDEQAKLIDFGALSSFGRSVTVVGTPPCVAPEALIGAQLDQRTDLYALGALAYWVLCGRHAFDVRAIADLPDAWQKQALPPPSAVAAELPDLPAIPEALDQLVLSLLSQNPLARPSSAAEVIGRLTAIAGLPPDQEPLSALSYLHGGDLIGRTRERGKLRKRLKSTLAGKGAVVVLEAEAGMGSGRLLHELATEARLLGATAAVVDADQHRDRYGVVEQIAHALLKARPDKARAAMQDDPDLARFVPGADSARSGGYRPLPPSERAKTDPRESRLRTQSALLAWIDRLASETPLLIAVRSFHAADDSSATLLATLASEIASRRVMLAVAYDPHAEATAPAALTALRENARVLELRGLSRDEVRELIESCFGKVPNTERLASWLHELTQGKPRACIELLQHLIEHDVIRFTDGVWALPQELAPHELPADLAEALELRLTRLTPESRRLALALCVERRAVPIERALALAELERVASPFRALSELEQRGVLVADDETLRFSHPLLRDAALHRLEDGERKRLHAQLGRLIAREGGRDANALLDAGWHLLHGGEERRGADLLAEAGLALSFDADGMPAAIPALEAALAAFRKQDRSRLALGTLLAPLAIAGFYTDRRVIEAYGDEAVMLLRDELGIGLSQRLRPLLGPRLSLWLGIASGVTRCAFAYGPLRAISSYREMLVLFITACVVMTGLGTLTLDGPRARRYADMLEPLDAFGRDHAATINLKLARALAMLPEDRIAETLAATNEVIEQLEAKTPIRDLAQRARGLMLAAALYTCGSLETFRESPRALRIADRLEGIGGKLYEMFANQVRANYHGLRGEEGLAVHYRRRVELFAVQAGSSWQAELWTACSAILCHMLTADVVGLKRVEGELARLAEDIPSLRRHAQLARACAHMIRGEAAIAREIGYAVLSAVEPRGFIGWGPCAAGEVRNLTALGEPEQALQFGLRVLSLYDTADRAVNTMVAPIVLEVALCEAQLGHWDAAAERIEGFLEELGERGGPATRGGLYEARARVALIAHQPEQARVFFERMEEAFRPTGNPALIARCERLRRELEADAADRESASDTLDLGVSATEAVRRALRECESPEQLNAHALALLLAETGAEGGELFRFDGGELRRVAGSGPGTPQAVLDRARAQARRSAGSESLTVASSDGETSSSSSTQADAAELTRYPIVLLRVRDGAKQRLLGALVLRAGTTAPRLPPEPLLEAVATALAAFDRSAARAAL